MCMTTAMNPDQGARRFWIGTSGWYYRHWEGRFYPEGLPSTEWLSYYTRHFSTVEVNASFYRLPFKGMVTGWLRRTPPGFRFVFKGSRRVTHVLKLRSVHESVNLLLERLAPLKERIACILWQLPPSLRQDLPLLGEFLAQLPAGYRYAIEFRHASWIHEQCLQLLAQHRVAHCTSAPGLPCNPTVTADFAYIRFHGISSWYNYDYTEEDLCWWRNEIRRIGGKAEQVFAFFNNDFEAHAASNALRLQELLAEGERMP